MVFSSIPAYLDPSNWQQHQSQQIIASSAQNFPIPPAHHHAPPPSPPRQLHGGGGAGPPRPGSMSERARLANLPIPETALKCPRCESTNTKFCYFNNYSLSQPRHFCKTCRRYWTRGGALRNVPVGGGCRRNKRSKPTSSKSPASADRPAGCSSSDDMSANSGHNTLLGLTPQILQPLHFMAPNLGQFNDSFGNEMGNYTGISGSAGGSSDQALNFPGGSGFLAGGVSSMFSNININEPWRVQQVQKFPFLGGLEQSHQGIFQFQGNESGFVGVDTAELMRPKLSTSILNDQGDTSMKMEENPNIFNWSTTTATTTTVTASTAAWADISRFSSSSPSNNRL